MRSDQGPARFRPLMWLLGDDATQAAVLFRWLWRCQTYYGGRRSPEIGHDDGLVNQDAALLALVVGFGIAWCVALVEPTTSATHNFMSDQTTLQPQLKLWSSYWIGIFEFVSGCWLWHWMIRYACRTNYKRNASFNAGQQTLQPQHNASGSQSCYWIGIKETTIIANDYS